jgi:hypothetical protein
VTPYLREIWSGLWSWDGIWPLSQEFGSVLALVILFMLGFIAGQLS